VTDGLTRVGIDEARARAETPGCDYNSEEEVERFVGAITELASTPAR